MVNPQLRRTIRYCCGFKEILPTDAYATTLSSINRREAKSNQDLQIGQSLQRIPVSHYKAIFDELRGQWEQQICSAQLKSLETFLATLVRALPERFDALAWMAQVRGERDYMD